MSDSMLTGGGSNIGDLILQAPAPVWAKIKKALGVQTRDQAAAIVQADDKARRLVLALFSGERETETERPPTRSESYLVPKQPTPLAEQMYGAKKAKVTF